MEKTELHKIHVGWTVKPRQNKKDQVSVVMLDFCMSFLLQAVDSNSKKDLVKTKHHNKIFDLLILSELYL